MSYSAYRPPGLAGYYPAGLTVEQIHQGNRNQVERSSRRWKKFVALEEAHGLDQLPDEARAHAYWMAYSLRICFENDLFVQRGWRKEHRHPPFSPLPYVPVLAVYLSEARLALLLSDLRRLAEETALAGMPAFWITIA